MVATNSVVARVRAAHRETYLPAWPLRRAVSAASSFAAPSFFQRRAQTKLMAAQRSSLAPTVPTVKEAGCKDLQQEVLSVAILSAATPDAVTQTLAHAFADAMKHPEVQKRLDLLDGQPNGATGAAMRYGF